MRTEQVAVVGREHDDGVVGEAARVELVEDAHDRGVDQHVQVVVEPPVLEVGVLRVQELAATPHGTARWQSGRPANESDCDGASGIVGDRVGDGREPEHVPRRGR